MQADGDFQTALQAPVQAYLGFLAANPKGGEIPYRGPLENLINAIKPPGSNYTVIQEDRRGGLETAGTPDFFVYEDGRAPLKRLVGFIECKKPSYKLEKLIDSEQIKKYSRTCENIILTNYHRFILLQKSRPVYDLVLACDSKTIMDFGAMLVAFYQYEYPYINNKKTLAKTLAAQSFYYSAALREFTADAENREDPFSVKFNALFSEYQKSINYHYELPDFCDIYAQSLVYGLMLARLDTGKNLDEQDLAYLRVIPAGYTLLIEFLSQAYESRNLPSPIKLALTSIGKQINLINIEAVNGEFEKTGGGGQSIAVYLYEDFLTQFDKLRGTENRKEGGVYYTPREAAAFIIRSVNEILKNQFKLPGGFAEKNVKTLDFACGTGTFLQSLMELLLPPDIDGLERQMTKEKIARDIYGFEINFTPYIIAHTIMTRFLAKRGVSFGKNERLGVYLTNTLDISQHSISALLPRLKQEHEKSMLIKGKEDILAITGNPPYFGGRGKAISGVIDGKVGDYKKNLAGEANLQPLDDLYIKFIRFAQWKIEKSGEGVVGIIVSNSFLDGLIQRQMRKCLYEAFDEIYIVNLHGSAQKQEGDKNIFDIMIGVCIIFMVKHKVPVSPRAVKYFSTLEHKIISRKEKLDFLEAASFSTIPWSALRPAGTKDYWFVKKDFTGEKTYKKFTSIIAIFNQYSSGIKTSHDSFCLSYSPKALDNLRKELLSNDTAVIREKYAVKDGRDWSLEGAAHDIKTAYNPSAIYYRPFDYRYTSLSKSSKGFLDLPRYDIMRHFDNRENTGIVFVRHFASPKPYTNVLVSQFPIENRVTNSFACSAYFAPLYLYGENLDGEHPGEITKIPNFTPSFRENYLASLDWRPSPEEILAYIYAALHSPVYRKKYREFLKINFPAVPMTRDKTVFYQYAALGRRLVDLHLLKDIPGDKSIKVSLGEVTGGFTIEKMTIANNNMRLSVSPLNKTAPGGGITFSGVTPDIIEFEIGSRKPVGLWIKNRIKDKAPLGLEDLQHIKNMLTAIKQTIAVMAAIEQLGEAYAGAL
ncbi:MAG: N-6 DNA methylase [Treponema sp.]|nr:N-6 DNA methylase [Treponema sp.]